ncbi:hypothetical protein KKF81_00260 [Candidatus Micrarchaeota archaeon]|nr:hypothetical protein [Candidatus Micrarchaeota archaeon]MBU1165350.1 hypothetical protein [Candidatus Micrarchaeota archaeon]MBU1886708.1 hypothetical protein [Candidatus Micrarchaeota archaeon]
MKWIFGLVATMLLFGCIIDGLWGGNQTDNETLNPPPANESGNQNNGSVNIILDDQQNQTIEQNTSDDGNGEENGQNTTPTTEMEYELDPEANIGVYFINVSTSTTHGDAILVKKGDFDMLIDAGPSESGGEVVDFLRSMEVDDLELVISTNADPRHYGGLELVGDNFLIEHFWWSGETFNDQEYDRIVSELEAKVKITQVVEKGFTTNLNGINIEILNPHDTQRFGDINNDAIVTRLVDREFSVLLTSGIQQGARDKIVNEQENKIKNKVIQAPYYGSGEGTRNIGLFLIRATPDIVIISGSADDASYNGGSREPFMRTMEQYNIAWEATYTSGTIRVTSDGIDYAVQAFGG